MDELESILWKTKHTKDYSYRKKHSHLLSAVNQISGARHISSFDELVLPSVSMMTLKHRETKQKRHHHRESNYGNNFLYNNHNVRGDFSDSYSKTLDRNFHQKELCIHSNARNYVNHANEKLGLSRGYLSNHNYSNHDYSKLGDTHYHHSNRFYDNNGCEKLNDIQNYGNRRTFRENCQGNFSDYVEHSWQCCYGNIVNKQKYLSNIKYHHHSDITTLMPPISVNGLSIRSDEKEMVVKYRIEKEREKDKKHSINEQTTLRTKSRRSKALTSKELNERLVKKDVSLPSPPLISNYIPKEERERQKFRPSIIHKSYKSLKEFEERRCCRVDDNKPTSSKEDNGQRTKRYVHVYLCCCTDG